MTLPKSGKNVEVKFITPRILDQIEARKREFARKSKGAKIDNSLLYTAQAIIKSIDGNSDPVIIESILRKLQLADTNTIMKYGDKLNSMLGLNAIIPNICTNCGVDYKVPFRITGEFFGPSLD